MNMFLVYNALNLSPKDAQVMLFDKSSSLLSSPSLLTLPPSYPCHSHCRHPDGPYYDLIKRAYSPSHPLLRHDHFKNKKVPSAPPPPPSSPSLSSLQILFKRLIFHLESPAGLIFPKVPLPPPSPHLTLALRWPTPTR
jgi:hypothetical protein